MLGVRLVEIAWRFWWNAGRGGSDLPAVPEENQLFRHMHAWPKLELPVTPPPADRPDRPRPDAGQRTAPRWPIRFPCG